MNLFPIELRIMLVIPESNRKLGMAFRLNSELYILHHNSFRIESKISDRQCSSFLIKSQSQDDTQRPFQIVLLPECRGFHWNPDLSGHPINNKIVHLKISFLH